ncbi:helix-turn-helix domain-containing protein, partial [Paramuribaculum intestinale]
FNEIGRAIPDISPKVLTDTLKSLEADGLISRKLYAEIPPKVEYSLTELGKSLMPLLGSLIEWALDNFNAIAKR